MVGNCVEKRFGQWIGQRLDCCLTARPIAGVSPLLVAILMKFGTISMIYPLYVL
jgi:hypothetical protein